MATALLGSAYNIFSIINLPAESPRGVPAESPRQRDSAITGTLLNSRVDSHTEDLGRVNISRLPHPKRLACGEDLLSPQSLRVSGTLRQPGPC